MVEGGMVIERVIYPAFVGDEPDVELSDGSLSPEQASIVAGRCAEKHPLKQLSDDEILQRLERWIGEYECLLSLGYRPLPPPSPEVFIASWHRAGPWMPIDGVDIWAWSDEEYHRAKSECTLEMFDRRKAPEQSPADELKPSHERSG